MKNTLILMLSLAMMLSLAACGRQAGTVQAAPQQTQVPDVSLSPVAELVSTEEETTEMKTEKIPAEVGIFDLERGVVLLNSGYEMPVLGIGCFMLSNEQAEKLRLLGAAGRLPPHRHRPHLRQRGWRRPRHPTSHRRGLCDKGGDLRHDQDVDQRL